MRIIYICAPLGGNIVKNCYRVSEAVMELMKEYVKTPEGLPMLFIPHLAFKNLTFSWESGEFNRPWGEKMCLKMVEVCDEMVVIGKKITEGMQKEIELAWILKKKVTKRPDL